MLFALALMLQATPAAPGPDVIVTGERLKKLHDQCRAGRCSPLRDAQASIAWAETLFRDGRYVQAKNTLRDAANRNKRNAATAPKPVAAIYEAYATVAWQEGDQDIYRYATAQRVRTLRENLPADDPAVRTAALALGDMWVRLGNWIGAERAYRAAEQKGLEGGQGGVAIRARLARARLRHALGDSKGAAELIASAGALPGAEDPMTRAAIQVVGLRLAAADGETTATDQLVKALGQAGFARPVLLYSPPYPATPFARDVAPRRLGQLRLAGTADSAELAGDTVRATDAAIIQWADIGFWVRPDGSVAEPEILRGSNERAWTKPYLEQVSRRRYSATANATDGPGIYRIERFTLRGNYRVPIGSLIRRRVGPADLEVLELTEPNAKVTASN